MHDTAVSTHLANIRGHLAAMQRLARQAADRRQAILDDHTYDTGARGKAARDEALRALAEEAHQRIDHEHRQAADVLAWSADAIREGAQEWRTPSPAAQAAGDRVRALLASGMRLPDVLGALVADDDQPALEYAHRSLAALARAAAGPRPNPAALAEYVRVTSERLTDARWDSMHAQERTFHTLRRGVAEAQEALPRERAYWIKTARGTATTVDKFEHGFAIDPRWDAMLDGTADGPVEAANAPEPVGA